jgi:hypothetical protein
MTRRITLRRYLMQVGLALVAVAALSAARLKDADLEMICDWFEGVYDVANTAGGIGALGHSLRVERVSSPMIGWHVFYAEERDANGNLIAQEFLSFELAPNKKSIVETSYSFREPLRWENGLDRPDIFKSIISDDLAPANGCEIFWSRDAKGFTGKSTPHACRLRSRSSGDAMQIDLSARLTPAEFTYGDRAFSKRLPARQ